MKLPKGKLGTARLAAKGGGAAIVLSEGKPPASFRVFRAGENESDYGPITFDDIAAAMVMQNAREKGNPFYFDFNHGMAKQYATAEEGKSAGTFEIDVIDGELCTVNCQYTEEGAGRLGSREYNLFSPYFKTITDDQGVCRPYQLLNIALLNLAGLNDLQAIAAGSSATQDTENDMTAEEIKRLQDRNAVLEAEVVTLRSASTELAALGGTLALGANAGHAERVGAVTGLLALRTEVHKITGQATDAAALGALEALREKAAKTDGLIAAQAKLETDALVAELNGVLDDGIKAAKIAPADREIFEAAALAKGAGKPSKEGILYLRARIDGRAKQVNTEETGQKKPPKDVTEGGRVLAIQMGIKPDDYELFLTDRPAWEAKQAAKRPGASAR